MEKLYKVYFSEAELQEIEDVLFEKSGIMSIIADDLLVKKEKAKAHKAKARSVYFERLAGKISLPLDEIYKAKQPTKENA
jgi:acetate kinase